MVHTARWALVLATAILASSSLVATPGQGQGPITCAPESAPEYLGFRYWLLARLTRPEHESYLKAIHVPKIDTARVVFVRSDSLCVLAGRMLNRNHSRLEENAPRSVHLARVDSVYLAEDRALLTGEFVTVLVLDSTLTRVLVRAMR